VARGTLDHAGDGRGFRERQVCDILAEIDARRLCDAAHGDCAALAQINLVTVEREDVLFGEATFERGGDERLVEFALERALRREVCVLDELLRDGRTALSLQLIFAVVARPTQERAAQSGVVETAMREEAPVFDGEDRVR